MEEFMSRVAIITDSNSGITQSQAKEMGIRVVPDAVYDWRYRLL